LAAQHAHDAPQVGQRLAAGLLDHPQRFTRRCRVRGGHEPRRAGLNDHHAYVVCDDIVQLARDPVALFTQCPRGPPPLLVAQAGGRLRQLARQPHVAGHDKAGRGRDQHDRPRREGADQGERSGSCFYEQRGRKRVAEQRGQPLPRAALCRRPCHVVVDQDDRGHHERAVRVPRRYLIDGQGGRGR
jgi:hypothetical protein